MLRGCRPFDIHSNTSVDDVMNLFQVGVYYPSSWSEGVVDLLSKVSTTFQPLIYIYLLKRLVQEGNRLVSLRTLNYFCSCCV